MLPTPWPMFRYGVKPLVSSYSIIGGQNMPCGSWKIPKASLTTSIETQAPYLQCAMLKQWRMMLLVNKAWHARSFAKRSWRAFTLMWGTRGVGLLTRC